MTDDDTKFERARRESVRRWEATLQPGPALEPEPAGDPIPVDLEDVLARWGDVDQAHGVPRESP